MGILSVVEIGHGLRGGEIDEEFTRTYTRHFRVRTDGPLVGAAEVLAAPGLPARYSAFPFDGRALCKRLRARETEDAERWEVEAEYSSDLAIAELQAEDPRTEPAKVRRGTEKYQKALEEDLDGHALLNTAQYPYAPPVEIEQGRVVFTVQKNLATIDEVDVEDNYLFRTNSEVFRGRPRRTLILTDFSAEDDFRNGVFFVATTWTFARLQPPLPLTGGLVDGRKIKVLDQGRHERVAGVSRPIREFGVPVSQDVLLDGNGARLAPGGPVLAVYNQYRVREEADFNLLGLGV